MDEDGAAKHGRHFRSQKQAEDGTPKLSKVELRAVF